MRESHLRKFCHCFSLSKNLQPGIHSTAVVDSSAQIDPSAHIGPHCVIGANVKIGARTILQGGNHVAAESVIGDDTRIFPNVTLYLRTQIGNRVRIHSGYVIGSEVSVTSSIPDFIAKFRKLEM